MAVLEHYLTVFNCVSDSDSTKKYKIAVDKAKSLETNTLQFSCNCKAFTVSGRRGKPCKHIQSVWSLIDSAWRKDPDLAQKHPEVFLCTMTSRHPRITFIPDLEEGDIQDFLGVELNATKSVSWSLGRSFTASAFMPPIIPMRMCCFCEAPQEISLDSLVFSCVKCGRRQLA